MLATCMYMQLLDLLLQHPDKNTCNMRMIQIKYLEYTLQTYVYSHCNIRNILIYFCNTGTKHLQHTSKTLKTYVCNMRFQCNISLLACCLGMEVSLLLGNRSSSVCGVHQCKACQWREARRSGREGRDRSSGECHSGSLR
jgi:hypothetical protein